MARGPGPAGGAPVLRSLCAPFPLPQAVLGACLSFLSPRELAVAEVACVAFRDAARAGGAWDAAVLAERVVKAKTAVDCRVPVADGDVWAGRGVAVTPGPGDCFARALYLSQVRGGGGVFVCV